MSSTTTTITPKAPAISYDINLPYTESSIKDRARTKYPEYLPSWDKVWFDRLPVFPYNDPALRVTDRSLPNLLTAGVHVEDIAPRLGSILHGIQLDRTSDVAKDELALLISERKVLVFPNQDLIDEGPARQQEFMNYFGKPNYQPVSGSVNGHPGFHIIHRDGNKEEIKRFFEKRTVSTLWHQDVSYEIQPPGYVMLGLLEGPSVGGDTVFAAADEAYRRLSPQFGAFLDKLRATHSSEKMIAHARNAGGLVRKDPITTSHPLVRVHPITKKKSLFLNGEFITEIEGLKEAETKLVLEFLLQHFTAGHDFQARVKWQPRTIVMFDNRNTIHSAIVDYIDDDNEAKPRHIFRLCAMTEVPIPVGDKANQ